MDCQCCQKEPANIRICDIEDNTMAQQFNVCGTCWTFIKRYLFDAAKPLIPTIDVLQEVRELMDHKPPTGLAMAEPGGALAPLSKEETPACPDCGMTLAEFKQKGRFGCARDYEVFAAHLEKLLERVHDVSPPRHKGRLPESAEGANALVAKALELGDLREQLRKAVTSENYELAARLRDRIAAAEGRKESTEAGK